MQGLVFTEFLEMVDTVYSPTITEKVILHSNVENNGAYTRLGDYSHIELFSLVRSLSALEDRSLHETFHKFGTYIMLNYSRKFPDYFIESKNIFDFIEFFGAGFRIEVENLYPRSEVPAVRTVERTDSSIEILYTSKLAMPDFVEGMLQGAFEYYKFDGAIQREDLSKGEGSCVRFLITQASKKKTIQ